MIIVNLIGGLGNQMFQYALGRRMALKNNAILKFDINGLINHSGGGTPRRYAINVFNIQENFADKKEIEKLKGCMNSRISRILQRLRLFKKRDYFVAEPHFNFYPNIFDVKNNIYLQGYWQTEKYFKDIEDVIRNEFTLKQELDIKNKEITKEIKKNNAISLHIRRGDYIADPRANKFHGSCSLEYYIDAIRCISEKVNNPVFYIFSDDIEWVKENLHLNYSVKYVSDETLKDYEEMILMSYCKHNIIANSSFSWWGAWLNTNPGKIVIAPRPWFADNSVDTSDLIPKEWICL